MVRQKRKLSNLLPNNRYAVRIRAYNGLGIASSWSEVLVIQTAASDSSLRPLPPTDLIINYDSSTLITSWTAPTANTDGSPLNNFDHYEVTLSTNTTSVTYNTTTPFFAYGVDSNIHDFGIAQGSLTVAVRAVNISNVASDPVTGIASNSAPPTPTSPPALVASFTLITITMTTPNLGDWGGYVLETSTNGTTWTLLATLNNEDTYIHQVAAGSIHYYRYKIIDKFGNISAGYSAVANITTHTPLVIDNFEVIDNLFIKSNLVIDPAGQIQSYSNTLDGGTGYFLTSSGATFENGGIAILGLGGFLSLDSTSLRAVYGGTTQLLADSTGVYIGGNNASSAEIYVDTSLQTTFIQGQTVFRSSATGSAYTFYVDLTQQTTGGKILRCFTGTNPSTGVDQFYITNDGYAYFAKGVINLGTSSAFHVDNSGNMWLGSTTFGAAPFSVSSAGALKATSGTFSGNVNGATITGGVFRTAVTGPRLSINVADLIYIDFNVTGSDYLEGAIYGDDNPGLNESSLYTRSPIRTIGYGYAQQYLISQAAGNSTAIMEGKNVFLRAPGPATGDYFETDFLDFNLYGSGAIQLRGRSLGEISPYNGFQQMDGPILYGNTSSGLGGDPAYGLLFRAYEDGITERNDSYVDLYALRNFYCTLTKAFIIDHPVLGPDHALIYASTESPRADLTFRGRAKCNKTGTVKVDIDATYRQTAGTFAVLTLEDTIQVFLYNESSAVHPTFTRQNGILTINAGPQDWVGWLVCGERGDDAIKASDSTDAHGRLINEHVKTAEEKNIHSREKLAPDPTRRNRPRYNQ
jgi:hypothetical protein